MLFDIGIGILLGLGFSPFDSTTTNALLGALFVLLPDSDAIIYYFLRIFNIGNIKQKMHDHREIFHYPLPYMTIGCVLLAIVEPALIPLFLAGSFAQFAHDSIGIGWGIPWLIPFSSTRFKFLYQYDLHQAGEPQRAIWRWSKAEQAALQNKYGDQDWHKHMFQIFKRAPVWHLIELAVFLLGLITLILV